MLISIVKNVKNYHSSVSNLDHIEIFLGETFFCLGKTIGIVDKDVTVIDLEKRPDKDKIIKELEQLTGAKFNI